MAHLIGWDYTNLEAIQQILAGQTPTFFQYSDKDWQSYNRRLVERYLRADFGQLLADAAESHRALLDYLEALPARDVVDGKVKRAAGRTITVRTLLTSEARDEMKHAEQVERYFVGSGKKNAYGTTDKHR